LEWKFAEARTKLSEVFDRAVDGGPQRITRRGRPTMIIITEENLAQVKQPKRDFKDWLLNGPDLTGVDFERDRSPMRELEW
jgi:prevent-host-death family protein